MNPFCQMLELPWDHSACLFSTWVHVLTRAVSPLHRYGVQPAFCLVPALTPRAGNGRVGRIIAAAAAKHLTPLTLELGGKPRHPSLQYKTRCIQSI